MAGIWLCYGMDKQGFNVQFLAAVTDFSLPQSIQTSSGAHSVYSVSVRGSFSRDKVNSTWSWQLTPSMCQVKRCTSTITIFLHGKHRDNLIILTRDIHGCVYMNKLWLYDKYLYSCLHSLRLQDGDNYESFNFTLLFYW